MKARSSEPETLLGQLAWVRALARSLVRDPASAEDVAQDTWLAAQSQRDRPRSFAWLAAVTRNFARQRFRGEASRRRRELLRARDERLPSSAELVSRTEQQQLVVQAVMRLDEPYRSTVLLRFVDGLAPSAIARRQGVPAATVRSRSKRALEQLRVALARDFGDRESWALLLLPLAWPASAPPALSSSATSLSTTGSLLMKKALALTLVLATIAGGTIWATRASELAPLASLAPDPTPKPSAARGASLVATPSASPEREDRARAQPPEAAPLAAAPTPVPTGWWLSGRVLGVASERCVQLEILCPQGPSDARQSGLAQPDGRVWIDLAPIFEHASALPDQLVVLADHPGYLPARVTLDVSREQRQAGFRAGPGAEFPLELRLLPAVGIVEGRARVPSGVDAGLLRAALVDRSSADSAPCDSCDCDADGAFSLRARHTGEFEVVVWSRATAEQSLAPLPRPESRPVRVEGGRQPLDLELSMGESLSGTITGSASRLGLEFCLVANRQDAEERCFEGLARSTGRFEYAAPTARSLPDGSFHFTGLGEGAYALRCSDPLWHGAPIRTLWAETSADAVRAVAPARGIELAWGLEALFFQVLSGGAELPGAQVEAHYRNGSTSLETGGDGRLVILHDGDELLDVRFSEVGHVARTIPIDFEALPNASWIPVELEALPGGRLVLPLIGDPQRRAEAFWVTFEQADSSAQAEHDGRAGAIEGRSCKRIADEIVLDGLIPGHYVVRVQPSRNARPTLANWILEQSFEVEIQSGAEVVHPLELIEGGRLSLAAGCFAGERQLQLRLLDELGQEVPVRNVSFMDRGWSTRAGSAYRDRQSFFVPTLPAGHYRLEAWAQDLPMRVVPLVLEAGETLLLRSEEPAEGE